MKNILILVEGLTEETFVRDVLSAYFRPLGIFIIPKILVTKVVPGGPNFTGGHGKNYGHIKTDLRLLLQNQKHFLVTTMLDFYGLPANTPGVKDSQNGFDCYSKVRVVENAIEQDISHSNFKAYLSLHEFEAFAFVNEALLQSLFPSHKQAVVALVQAKQTVDSVERINLDNPPSKRLLKSLPNYSKPIDGPLMANLLGIEALCDACPHFAEWVSWLKS